MSRKPEARIDTGEAQFVTMRIHNQLLGLPVHDVREIISGQKITPVPLVSEEIAGVLNLRGRIVTAIDIRHRLRLPARDPDSQCFLVVVEHQGDLYSLIVDSFGDVLTIPRDSIQENLSNLSLNWRNVSAGVYHMEQELLVILTPGKLFTFGQD